jgi:hypothetical protein
MSRIGAVACVTIAVACGAGAAHAAALTGTAGDDVLVGTTGADDLFGLAGNDQLRGARGDDVLAGGPGSDDLAGGPGRDAVVYAGEPAVSVTLDDLANDGPRGESDNVQTDVEEVYGTPADDLVVASAGAETLDGAAGDDYLDGGGGADQLYGADGNDRVTARDGRRDAVDCGPGADIAIVDDRDAVTGCEIIDRRPAVPRVDATVAFEWMWSHGRTAYSRLALEDVDPAGIRVELRCSGACPFSRRVVPRRSRPDLTDDVAQLRAAPGDVLDIRLTMPGRVGKLVRFRARAAKAPERVEYCLRGGRARPERRCP